MPGVSIHVVDVARSRVAQGLVVRVERLGGERRTTIAQASAGAGGSVDELATLAESFAHCTPSVFSLL